MKNEKGSVYQMKDCKRRRPWRAISTGVKKGKRITIGTFETRQEALDALYEFNKNPYSVENKKITFLEITEMWKKEHLPKVGKGRRASILSKIKKMSPLYDLIFADVKLIDLQAYFNNLTVSTGTKKEYKSTINLIFEYGIKYDIIQKNPSTYIEIGKHKKVREANIFTYGEISILWKYHLFENTDIILILIYTGLRINELLTLKKENVFIDDRYIITGSKTEAGKDRLIPLHKDLIPLVKRRYKESFQYLIENKGGKVKYETVKKLFNEVLEKLELETHRIHDTRHTFATLINNSGANSTSIKNIIGHSDFALTEKVYTHKDKSELLKAIDMINLKEA